MKKHFKINNRIDLGTDGSFTTGSESRLEAALNDKKDGDKIFASLVQRGAIVMQDAPEQQKPKAPKVNKPTSKSTAPKSKKEAENDTETTDEKAEQDSPKEDETKVEEQPEQADDEKADNDKGLENNNAGQPDYKPTGKWEKNGYGGGMFEIINPEGFVVDTIRGEEKADARIEKENAKS